MGFLDFFTSNEESTPVLGSKTIEEVKADELSPLTQEYSSEIAEELGYEADSVKTKSQWNALNAQESARLMQEEEDSFYNRAVKSAMDTGTVDGVKEQAEGLAHLSTDYKEIPHAAAISAQRERLVEADFNNPNKALLPTEYRQREDRLQTNRAILQDWIKMMENKEESASEFISNIYGDFPVIEAKRYRDAVRALGVQPDPENVDLLSKADASTYITQFMNLIKESSNTMSPRDFTNLLVYINKIWSDNDTNIYVQKDLIRNLNSYSPGLYTFNALTAPWFYKDLLGPKAKVAPKAGEIKSTSTDLIPAYEGLKESSRPVEKVLLFDDAIQMEKGPDGVWRATWDAAETFEATANKGVRPTVADTKAERMVETALSVGDREKAARLILQDWGKPSETARPIKASANYKYTIDPLFHPVDPVTTNLSRSVEVSLADYADLVNERIQLALADAEVIPGLKRQLSEFFIRQFVDSTHLENSIGITKPQLIEQLIGTIDQGSVQVGTEGDLFATFKLPNNGMDFTGIKGFHLAEKRAKEVVKNTPHSTYRLSPTPDGQWETTIQVKTDSGWSTIYTDFLTKEGDLKQAAFRPSFAGIATATSRPTALSGLVIARAMEVQEYNKLAEQVTDKIHGLSKKGRKTLQSIIDAETFEGAEYSNDYILERLSDNKEAEKILKAHMDYQALNRYDAIVRNNATRRYGVSIGAKSISFNNERIPGFSRVVEGNLSRYEEVLAKKNYIAVDNLGDNIQSVSQFLKGDTLKNLYNKGYRLVEVNLSPESTVAADYLVYFLNPHGLVVNDLPVWVTSYVPGGRSIYSDKAAFVKQINTAMSPESGRINIVGVKTFMIDEDEEGLKQTVAILNEMFTLYSRDKFEALEKLWMNSGISLRAKGFKSGRDLIENWAMPSGVDVNNIEVFPLEVVKNNVLLDSYKRAAKDPSKFEDVAGFEAMEAMHRNSLFQALDTESKIKKMRRTGRALATFNWERAMPLDIEGEIRAMVHRTLKNGSMSEFTDFWADWFAREYGDVLASSNDTPYQKLVKTPILDDNQLSDIGKKKAAQAREARKQYNAIRQQPSQFDSMIMKNVDTILHWVDDAVEDIPMSSTIKHGLRISLRKLRNAPIQHQIRWVTSMWTFAGSPAQLIKQAAAVAYIGLIEPENSLEAITSGFKATVLWKVAGGDRARFMNTISKYYKDDEVMLNNMKNFMGSNLFDAGVGGGLFEKGTGKLKKLSDWLLLPYSTGESYNRIVAYLTALKATGNWGKIITSPAERIRVSRKASAFFLHMDEASLSRFQKSQIFQTLTQFQSQRMRFAETVLFDKELTGAQRARLGLGTLMLVGPEGILGTPLYSWAAANVFTMTHETDEDRAYAIENRNEIWRAIEKGVLNYISEISGADIDLGKIIAPEVGDLGETLLNIAGLEIPSKGALSSLFEDAKFLIYAIKDGVFGEATSDDLLGYANRLLYEGAHPAAVRPFKGFLFYQNGMRLSRKGELADRCEGALQATMYGLGFDSLDTKEVQRFYVENEVYARYYKNVKDEVYRDFMEAVNSEGQRGLDNMFMTLKLANIPTKDKIKILTSIQREAVQKHNMDAIERATLQAINAQGSKGISLLQKDFLRRKNEQ